MISAACLALLLGTATPAAPSDGVRWSQIRAGLTREQVAERLGQPLLRNAARGQEHWVYDAGCDVQFENGVVKWWTAPRAPAPPPPAAASHISPPKRDRA